MWGIVAGITAGALGLAYIDYKLNQPNKVKGADAKGVGPKQLPGPTGAKSGVTFTAHLFKRVLKK